MLTGLFHLFIVKRHFADLDCWGAKLLFCQWNAVFYSPHEDWHGLLALPPVGGYL